jgi:hypothetical protein
VWYQYRSATTAQWSIGTAASTLRYRNGERWFNLAIVVSSTVERIIDSDEMFGGVFPIPAVRRPQIRF